jgi:hypothetical protein
MITRQYVLSAALILAGLSAGAVHSETKSCQAIRQACLKAGFQPGKGPSGLERACLRPIVFDTTPPNGATRALPTIDPKTAADCRVSLEPAPPAKAPAAPANSETSAAPASRPPTAVAPHNPPPTDPGPDAGAAANR